MRIDIIISLIASLVGVVLRIPLSKRRRGTATFRVLFQVSFFVRRNTPERGGGSGVFREKAKNEEGEMKEKFLLFNAQNLRHVRVGRIELTDRTDPMDRIDRIDRSSFFLPDREQRQDRQFIAITDGSFMAS